jgi:hypothetical protein
MVIQFILSALLLAALVVTLKRSRQGAIGRWSALLWSLLWIGAAVAILRPEVTSGFAAFVGVGRGVDVVTYFSIVFLFALVFKVFLRIEKLERDITALVREIGLEKKRGERRETERS